jgi:RND family efflux transporter MFP subunit
VHRPALVVLAGLILASTACGGAPEERGPADVTPALPVSTGIAETTDWTDAVEVGGVLRPRVTAVVSSRILAPVVAVHVRAGDRVERGQSLIDLEGGALQAEAARSVSALEAADRAAQAADAAIAGAEAALELARQTHSRIRSLHEQRSATAQELDEATAGLAAAEARAAAARAQASSAAAAFAAAGSAARAGEIAAGYGVLSAPFDAVVAERRVDPGSMATPGAPLLVLEAAGALRLEVQVDASRVAAVRAGMPVEVRADVDGRESSWIEGRVAEIARVDAAAHSFDVKIDVTAPAGWRSGLFGRARFTVASRSALTVPAAGLVRRGQLTMVFVVGDDDIASLRAIRVGDSRGDRVEVLAGLSGGEAGVVDPPVTLEDGHPVTAASSGAGR